MAQTVLRSVTFTTTGPSAMPSRLANMAGDLSLSYSQMTSGEIKVSTSSAVTLNFQGMTVAQLMVLWTNSRLKVRINGLAAVGLGLTSSLSTGRMMMLEGSTTSLVVSNPSATYVAGLEYVLAGR